MIGSSSLLETGLFKVTFVVPSGAKNGGRALPNGFSRLGTFVSWGLPTNIGFGSFISIGTKPAVFAGAAGSGSVTSAGFSATGSVTVSAGFLGSSATDLTVLGAGDSNDAFSVGSDFLHEGIKHKDIITNTQTQIFTIEPNSFVIISFLPQKLHVPTINETNRVIKLHISHEIKTMMLSYLYDVVKLLKRIFFLLFIRYQRYYC